MKGLKTFSENDLAHFIAVLGLWSAEKLFLHQFFRIQ